MGFWTLRLKKRASTCPSMPDKQLEIIMCKAKNDSAYHEPALRIACSQGRSDILKEMLSNPLVDPSILNNTPIRTASTNGHLEVVQLLLTDPRVDPSAGDSFAERDECIRMAAFNGHTDIVKLLIADPRVNPAADNDFALRMASLKGHEEIVSILLKDRRVNPAAGDVFTTNEPIRVACQMGHFGIVNLLMSHPKTDASSNKNAAIQIAAMRGHADIVQLLMKDERVTKNLCGLTDALKLAEEHGHTQVAQILLRDHRLAAVTSNQTSVVTISASLQASSSVNAIQNPLAVDGRSLSI